MEAKHKLLGLALLVLIVPFVAATITYTGTYAGTVTGTSDTDLLDYVLADEAGSLGTASLTEDDLKGGFSIIDLVLPSNTITEFDLLDIDLESSVVLSAGSTVEITVTVTAGAGCTVVIVDNVDFVSGVATLDGTGAKTLRVAVTTKDMGGDFDFSVDISAEVQV